MPSIATKTAKALRSKSSWSLRRPRKSDAEAEEAVSAEPTAGERDSRPLTDGRPRQVKLPCILWLLKPVSTPLSKRMKHAQSLQGKYATFVPCPSSCIFCIEFGPAQASQES